MSLFLQFVGPLGEPVYVRPDRVDGIREVSLMVGGRPVRGTFVLLASRETFKVQGSADAVAAAIGHWHAENAPKFTELTVDPMERRVCGRRIEVNGTCPNCVQDTNGVTHCA